MELDDLRRQWHQPEPMAPAALTASQLHALLARQRGGLVAKMRRNVHWDTGLAVAISLLALAAVLPGAGTAPTLLFAGVLALLVLLILYFYYRMLAVLRQMDETTGSVRSHLLLLGTGLRRLLRFYYYLSLAAAPLMLCLLYGFVVGRELARAGNFRGSLLLGVGTALLVLGAVLQVAVVRGSRWWVHRLYGQHLDRLEANLRELNEPGPGA